MRGKSISRILYRIASAMTIHLRAPLPTRFSCQPGPSGAKTTPGVAPHEVPIWHCSRWGLPCRSCCQSRGGLLPHRFTLTPDLPGRFVLCGAFPGVTPAGRYPAPLFCGVRTFLDQGLRPGRGHPTFRALSDLGASAAWVNGEPVGQCNSMPHVFCIQSPPRMGPEPLAEGIE